MDLNKILPSMASMPYMVIKATNDDNWGPHNRLMSEIAELTFSPVYNELMLMLWKRVLSEGRTNWRRVYKGCTLLIYLIKHGSHRVIHSIQDRVEELRVLEDIRYPEENGRNVNRNVQTKVNELLQLVEDSDLIERERNKVRELKLKFAGISSSSNDRYSFSSARDQKSSRFASFDDDISGKWRSTNPGIFDKISEVGERFKEFVADGTSSFKNESDNESIEDLPDINTTNYRKQESYLESKECKSDFDDFSDYQQAEEVKTSHGNLNTALPQNAMSEFLFTFDDTVPITNLMNDNTSATVDDLFTADFVNNNSFLNSNTDTGTHDDIDLFSQIYPAKSASAESTAKKDIFFDIENNEQTKESCLIDFNILDTFLDKLSIEHANVNVITNPIRNIVDDPSLNSTEIAALGPTIAEGQKDISSQILNEDFFSTERKVIQPINKAKIPDTWGDSLHMLNIDIDCLTKSNKTVSKIPMMYMKK
ncbi:hypothetical protein GJ496_010908 [Pomphorhynchus laevis]|nr:hypothetical protein GJ496_010908 [Pomphorhynchus laevis]